MSKCKSVRQSLKMRGSACQQRPRSRPCVSRSLLNPKSAHVVSQSQSPHLTCFCILGPRVPDFLLIEPALNSLAFKFICKMLRRTSLLATQVRISSDTARPALRARPMLSLYGGPVIKASAQQRRHISDYPATAQKDTHSKVKDYHGACHCGGIKVHLRTQKTPSELGARACQCSFCKLHGGSYTSDAAGALSIETSGPVNRYRMGTGTAEFLICTNCGVVPAATWKRDDGKLLSVVRVQCLDIRDELEKYTKKWSLDGELANPEERFRRRSRTWTPTDIQK
jgi:hypothetical protein